MKIKFHYSLQDDVLTVYTGIAPSETIEFTDFMNIDISKDKMWRDDSVTKNVSLEKVDALV